MREFESKLEPVYQDEFSVHGEQDVLHRALRQMEMIGGISEQLIQRLALLNQVQD